MSLESYLGVLDDSVENFLIPTCFVAGNRARTGPIRNFPSCPKVTFVLERHACPRQTNAHVSGNPPGVLPTQGILGTPRLLKCSHDSSHKPVNSLLLACNVTRATKPSTPWFFRGTHSGPSPSRTWSGTLLHRGSFPKTCEFQP